MKSADARAPQFDSRWWKQNKAKDADANGAFEKALKEYEDAKKTFASAKDLNALEPLGKKLDAVMKLAKTMKGDSKLGVMQKDTKDALANYEKIAVTALNGLATASRDSDLHGNLQDLIKRKSKPLEAFCTKEHSTENFEFLVLMATGVKNQKVYDRYVAKDSPKQINISSKTLGLMQAVAAKGADAKWDSAPWPEATKEIYAVMLRDTIPRYKTAYLQNVLKTVKLP